MIEMIPNWHPIFVHFTVALFSTAVGFYSLSFLSVRIPIFQTTLSQEFETVARWCLWVVSLLSIITVIAGLQAYYTVNHDAPSHMAMTNHRNWAIPTAICMVLMALWSMWRYRKGKAITLTFLIGLLIVQGLLLSTAWRGAELVFRYGLGVMSLPQSEGKGHQHQHPAVSNANLPNNTEHNMVNIPEQNTITTQTDAKNSSQSTSHNDNNHHHSEE